MTQNTAPNSTPDPTPSTVDDYQDPFVIIEGGLVANTPKVPYYDLDILNSDSPWSEIGEEVMDLLEEITKEPDYDRARYWIEQITDHIKAYGTPEQIAKATELTTNTVISVTEVVTHEISIPNQLYNHIMDKDPEVITTVIADTTAGEPWTGVKVVSRNVTGREYEIIQTDQPR